MNGFWIFLIVALVVVAAAWEPVRRWRRDRKEGDAGDRDIAEHFSVKFPCKLNGRVDPPPQDVRIANREKQLAAGDPLGGGFDGGIYLAGAFAFDVDSAGRMLGEFILHGERSKITGTIQPNGQFEGGHDGGSFRGVVTDAGVSGTVHEGGGREWVYGDMVGTYRKVTP